MLVVVLAAFGSSTGATFALGQSQGRRRLRRVATTAFEIVLVGSAGWFLLHNHRSPATH
jgi:hypothetical protein